MNCQIDRYAKWYPRIVDPKVIPYEFKSKNEIESAEKFERVLGSLDMLAHGCETHQALPVQQQQQDHTGGGRADGSGDGSGATLGTERGEEECFPRMIMKMSRSSSSSSS